MSDVSILFKGSSFSAKEEQAAFQDTLSELYKSEVASFYWGNVCFQSNWYEDLLLKLAVEIGDFKSWANEFQPLIRELAHEFPNSDHPHEYTLIGKDRLIEKNELFHYIELAENTSEPMDSYEFKCFTLIIYAFVFLYGISDGNIGRRFSIFLTQLCRQLNLWPDLSDLELDAKHTLHFRKIRILFYENLHGTSQPTSNHYLGSVFWEDFDLQEHDSNHKEH